ncbi:cadherin-related family member 4 isoform X1 [Ahaetulla prasina]|uniref:cadherin-related family member 4 isoform X1 n=1 Tax=Ahaetulla prasina TaxID=499056 RepID=UPI002647CAE7|nr:cadherin-related family member 4 isoform X1 [Ahaetulla prasina]
MQRLGLVEWDRPSFLFLLFIAWAIDPDIGAEAIEFRDLPKTVELEETAEPNSVVTTFSVSCTNTSDVPEISLKTVTPVSSFFEHLILSAGNYQVRLSPSAALDARVVNLYALTFTANCTGETKDAQLFVQVNETKRLVCNEGYTDIGRLPIQVSEDARPGETIYTTVLKRRGTGKLTFTVENSSLPFVVTSEGVLQVPATGFTREQAGKTFSLKIVIKDATSISCEVPLSIQVNPVYHNKVSFRESSVACSIPENVSPLFDVIQVRASGESVLYQIISPITNYFTIEPETGIIRTTYYLDLKKNPSLADTQLEVKAYNMFHHVDHASITVNITVKQENLEGPLCSPAVIVTEVPEDFLIGSTILPLSCYDPENINSSLTYNIVNQDPPYSFKMDGPNFQVNSSLDCDSESMATRNFQYNAAILVIDEGSPAQTTTVSVLVTVRQVNEFLPKCSKWVFYVPENTEYGYSIGNVNGSDQDYPFNNIEYSIMDGDARVFYINSHTGQLHVLLPLDFEDQKVYHLAVILKDLENEAAPGTQKTTRCNVTIFVQDVNDRPPKCKKPFFVYSIYSTQATDIEITDINCEDEDRGNELTYNIARGNVNGRFHMVGNKLFHNTFSYRPDGIYDPLVFVLLVEVSDGHFSTTVTVVVNVIPWATTVSTTTITTTTTPKKPIVLHRTVTYWAPDPWFVVVLTLTGILFFSALGLLFWQFCRRKSPGEISQSLLQNSSKEVGKNYKVTEEARKQKRKDAIDLQSLEHQFDGRAQDPVSGQYYLFDSSSGARRWV